MKSWIARHTGLPSFALQVDADAPAVIDATDSTGRSWEAVSTRGTGGTQMLSDPLALPGASTTYTPRWAPDEAVTLTRPESEWWRGLVSRYNGRVIPGLAWVKDKDQRSWSSGIERFNAKMARWALADEAITGTGTFMLFEEAQAQMQATWDLLRRHEPLLVVPGEATDTLPPRVVTVDSVTSNRVTGEGWLEFAVTWTEVPLDSPMLRRADGTAGAPVVTWGEWKAFEGAWQPRTYEWLCQQIAGMPG